MSSTTAPEWRLYTVDEVAAMLNKSRQTVYRWVKDPRNPLPHHNVRGSGIQFTQDDIDLIMAQSERGCR